MSDMKWRYARHRIALLQKELIQRLLEICPRRIDFVNISYHNSFRLLP